MMVFWEPVDDSADDNDPAGGSMLGLVIAASVLSIIWFAAGFGLGWWLG